MYFPWIGLFEQIRLADVYVHYDDVPFSKGSFVNRVRVKTPAGTSWLTIPLHRRKLGDRINMLMADESQQWRRRHLDQLREAYRIAPYRDDMLDLVTSVLSCRYEHLAELLIAGMENVCRYFGLQHGKRFARSSTLGVSGRSTERVLSVVRQLEGDIYVTGHGARHYLDHEAFQTAGVSVQYMNYQRRPHRQLHGEFDPHMSVLDLIANLGPYGTEFICSSTLSWRSFLNRRPAA